MSCASESATAPRVLIVEDVPALRMLLRLALEPRAAEVRDADSLRSARAQLKQGFQPELVVLDLELGDGHGLDLIRQLPKSAAVHVLTADTTREVALRCQGAGCASVVDKTQDLGTFVDRLFEHTAAPLADTMVDTEAQADRRYVEFLAESRVTLSSAVASGNHAALRNVAHRLRGTAVHFGYSSLGTSALALADALRANDAGALASAAAEVSRRLGEAIQIHRSQRQMTVEEEIRK